MSDEKIVNELQNLDENENTDAPKVVEPGDGADSTYSVIC
jgi:hypothetical protein